MSNYLHSLRGAWKRHVVWATLLTGFIVLLGCSSKAKEQAPEDEIVQYTIGEPITDSTIAAIVISPNGGDTMTTADFNNRLSMIFTRFPMVQDDPEQSRELRRNILEDFVMRHALYQEAERLNIVADTGRVAAQLSRIRGQYPSPEAFQQALASENITEDSLRKMIGEEVRLQTLQERMLEGVADPTEADVETYRQEQAQQVRAQHILFPVSPSARPGDEDSVKKTAQAVLDSARAGTDFAELARRHSADATAAQGGDLDYFSKGQMVPAFERAAYALADSGDVTKELVRTRFGYHIIRLTGKRQAELMDTSSARQGLLNQRRQKAVQASVNELRRGLTVRLNPAIVDTDLNVVQDL